MAHFRRQALSRLCLEFAFEIDSNQSHLAHCHKNDDNDMTCIFFIIGDNDVVGEGLFDSEAKELKQVVLIWPISPNIFTEIKSHVGVEKGVFVVFYNLPSAIGLDSLTSGSLTACKSMFPRIPRMTKEIPAKVLLSEE